MNRRRSSSTLYWFTIGCFIAAIAMMTWQLIAFSRSRVTYPAGLEIGGVPVGNLDRQGAAERLLEVYSLPVELHYNDQIIHMSPGAIGFELDLESMLAAADLSRTGGPFWQEFWNYIWGNQPVPSPVPLDAEYSEAQLRDYLRNEVAARYDSPAIPAQPIAGTLNYEAGTPGTEIDMDEAIFDIENALFSSTDRAAALPIRNSTPPRPSFQNLEIQLKQTIDQTGFDGIAGMYLFDLQTANELHFIYQNGEDIPVEPDLAFSAASVIKIPIMVSAYRRLDNEDPPDLALSYISGMIELSENTTTDALMKTYIDIERGPLAVTEDMRTLGLENSFLAGFFAIGSPRLQDFVTPANSRTDYSTDPDSYSQTTLSDIGALLTDIYQCEQFGGGALIAAFPEQITQQECQEMVTTMTRDFSPYLVLAGVPEGTRVAHKHGWVSDLNGNTRDMSDASIVYTPAGDFVLVFMFTHPVQLVFNPVSNLISDLTRAVYNYYNQSAE